MTRPPELSNNRAMHTEEAREARATRVRACGVARKLTQFRGFIVEYARPQSLYLRRAGFLSRYESSGRSRMYRTVSTCWMSTRAATMKSSSVNFSCVIVYQDSSSTLKKTTATARSRRSSTAG